MRSQFIKARPREAQYYYETKVLDIMVGLLLVIFLLQDIHLREQVLLVIMKI